MKRNGKEPENIIFTIPTMDIFLIQMFHTLIEWTLLATSRVKLLARSRCAALRCSLEVIEIFRSYHPTPTQNYVLPRKLPLLSSPSTD